jgi:hypothetical protein
VDSPSTEPGSGRADCIVPSQQRRIVPIRTPQGREFIWIGDLWESNDDGIKGHDATYWHLLKFDETGMIEPLSWTDRWSATILVPTDQDGGG